MEHRPKLLVLCGPTASGKTALGVALAQARNGEVVSADSMQIYRRMDIGTAKPTAEEMGGVPHHMLDVADPAEDYSVARYVRDADACVQDILARGRLPIVVGGTGLYIDSLLSGRDFAPRTEGELRLREELGQEYDTIGGAAFREKLREVDPERAEKLHPEDKRRLVRAMEIFRLTGEPITVHDKRSAALPPRFESVKVALSFRTGSSSTTGLTAGWSRWRRPALPGGGGPAPRGLGPGAHGHAGIGYKETAATLRGERTRRRPWRP